MNSFDIIVIGAGAAGMPAAIFAANRGARVLLVEAASEIGGTFHISSGQISAAGSRLQAANGLVDSPDTHFEDIMRINGRTGNPALIRLAVDNAVDTLHWLLDNGFEPIAGHPIVYDGHEHYSVPRTCWAVDKGKGVLKVIAPLVAAAEKSGNLTVWLDTPLDGVIRGEDGAVSGVAVTRNGERVVVDAKAVILATGGFAANPKLFDDLTVGRKLYSGAWEHATGKGLEAALDVGAAVVNKGLFLPIFAAVADERAMGGYIVSTFTNPLYRAPWEIFVDDRGARFYAEDQTSCDFRERALGRLPETRFWMVFDQGIRDAAPSVFVDETLSEKLGNHPDYVVADSIEDLAAQTGMDLATIKATIAAYNDTGRDDEFGRKYRPLPIEKAPFYAIRHYAWSILSFAGLSIDSELRVTDTSGKPIPNLYAAGEILGFGQTGGGAYVGGMSVTPAMTFGRLLGDRLGQALAGEGRAA